MARLEDIEIEENDSIIIRTPHAVVMVHAMMTLGSTVVVYENFGGHSPVGSLHVKGQLDATEHTG